MELTELINKIIDNSYSDEPIDKEYQDTFSKEGERKANYIIDDLRYKESKNEIIINRLCYLSIGGADGSEVEKVLNDTEISKAILIEISDAAAQMAREKAAKFANTGKEMIVIQGDAYDRLDDSLKIIQKFTSDNLVSGLVVSAQAVLHELPWRSNSYDLPIFLGKLYNNPNLDYCLFYSREPCDPLGWTDRVRIKIKGVKNDDFYRLVCHVRDRLKITGSPQKLASNWLDVESNLAIESLHKLLRSVTLKRIEYELGEQLTGFNPMEVKKNLESCVDGMNVSLDYIITMGFKRALIDNNVEYVGHNSELLPIPKTHVEIIGFKTKEIPPLCNLRGMPRISLGIKTKKIPPQETPIRKIETTDKIELTELPPNFSNPFDGDISNERILNWINQFESDEIPLVLRLVENFNYLSIEKIENQCKILYQKILSLYNNDISNLVFIPFGRASKSSGIITYYFRVVNEIPDEKFVSSDSLSSSKLKNKILIFIDDILASGHQALHEISKVSNQIDNKLCLSVLVACEQGIELLYEKSNIDIVSSLEIKRTDNPLDNENMLFNNIIDKEKVRNIIVKYGKQGKYSNPFGYEGTSLLLGFHFNTPDNTFPMFWSGGDSFKPLLKSKGYGRQSPNDIED